DLLGRHPHAFWFKPHAGELDSVAARALVLETPSARLAWVSVDLIAVDRAFTRAVERRLEHGIGPATVLVSASHTHSGPGAFVESRLMGWIALVWTFAIHGTVLGARNLRLSGDVMGVASRELERDLGIPVLFVNGAVGDVSPAAHGEAALARLAPELARAARAAWDHAGPRESPALAIRRARVALPSPRLSVRNCAGRWVPASVTVPLGLALPQDAELTAVALGGTAWVTIPG